MESMSGFISGYSDQRVENDGSLLYNTGVNLVDNNNGITDDR